MSLANLKEKSKRLSIYGLQESKIVSNVFHIILYKERFKRKKKIAN